MRKPYTCAHDAFRLTVRVLANKAVVYAQQCDTCGAQVGGFVPHRRVQPERVASLPAWDHGRYDAWQESEREYSIRYRQEQIRSVQHVADMAIDAGYARERKAKFDAVYADYLRSAPWRALRRKVLERSGGRCEGCADAAATQVHHLTYERVGREMLFDLVALCAACHAKVHGHEAAV